MVDYSTDSQELQEVILGAAEGRAYLDIATGEVVTPLRDSKFAWRERKRATLRLAAAYSEGYDDDRAERARTCSTWMEYYADESGSERQLRHYNACKQRLCPLCAARKAHIMARRLIRTMERARAEHPDCEVLFLTLTVRSVRGEDLRAALDALTRGWYRLCHRRAVERAIGGWYRAIEITRNGRTGTYHPHIHAILMAPADYARRSSGLYITHARWREMWQQSLRADYAPQVRIQRARGKAGAADAAASAVVEAAKYACKDSDYIGADMELDECAEVVSDLTAALARKRMTALGGWLLTASRELELELDDDAEVDLVHGDDNRGIMTAETAPMLEDYRWYHRVSEHLLVDRRDNPDYIGAGQAPDGAESVPDG